jgi:hypothetical protein
MFFGEETSKTCKYSLDRKIFLPENASQFEGNSEVEEKIL